MQRHPDFDWLIPLPSCASTNSSALAALQDLGHGDCIWTTQQTAGRGQAARSWASDPGVLTASFVIELDEDLLGPAMSLCAGLAVAHCVEDLSTCSLVHIKWPNDCFINGRKLAGILCEGKRCQDTFRMVIGIGLNVNPSWKTAPIESQFNGRPPISIADCSETVPDLLSTLHSLRSYLLESVGLIKAKRWQVILPGIRKRDWLMGQSCLIGQNILVEQEPRALHGIGAGIDEDGSLLIRLPDGGCMSCSSSFNLRVMDTIHG